MSWIFWEILINSTWISVKLILFVKILILKHFFFAFFQALESPSLGVFSNPSCGQISAKIPPGTFEEMFSGFCDGRRQICKICWKGKHWLGKYDFTWQFRLLAKYCCTLWAETKEKLVLEFIFVGGTIMHFLPQNQISKHGLFWFS